MENNTSGSSLEQTKVDETCKKIYKIYIEIDRPFDCKGTYGIIK